MTDGLVPIRRALLSVSDKRGVVEFARTLAETGVELISTGGTAKALSDAGLKVIPIDRVTGFPEMMDGRVKTLHPKVHGGLLAVRDEKSHTDAMAAHGIEGIDLLCVNLYPFEKTVAREGVSRDEAVEQIDIGGPAMVRSAAKNHEWVVVLTEPDQYARVIDDLRAHRGATTRALRRVLAASAFERTSAYDAAIASYLSSREGERFPAVMSVSMPKQNELRYGENPHQHAAVYRDRSFMGASVVGCEQLHGKELSYNNLNDASAALELVRDLSRYQPGLASACVVKHASPCGAASAVDGVSACDLALAGDPVAAFGGILALSREMDAHAADRLCEKGVFLEVILAPGFSRDALDRLRDRWANVRLLAVGPIEPLEPGALAMRTIPGGMLVQERDVMPAHTSAWVHAAGPRVDEQTLRDAGAVWLMGKHLASNAVVLGGREPKGARMFGAGAGQMDRVGACRIAVHKAGDLSRGAIAASDAFFPFADGPEVLINAGVKVIVHPGGSKRDADTFDLCDKHSVTCLTTGVRHFRH